MAYRLLLMDDSVTIRRVIELTFAGEDVEVTTVGDGRTAMERIEADPPDIVLADAGTARPDGYEVASFVKSNPALAHIPVLLLSGAFQPIDQARAREARCDGVLAKPFELQSVIARVKALLEQTDAGNQSEQKDETGESPGDPGTDTRAPSPDAGTTGPDQGEADPCAVSLNEYLGWLEELPGDSPSRQEGDRADGIAETPTTGTPAPLPASCLDDYFDLVDEVLARMPAAPSAGDAVEIPPYEDTKREAGKRSVQ